MIKPDWSTAPEWAQYWAIDNDGRAYWYEHKPTIEHDDRFVWSVGHIGRYTEALPRNYAGWKESLEKRP